MKCIYSVPIEHTRYRVYKCEKDNKYYDTIEIPPEAAHKTSTILARVTAGRKQRFGTIKWIMEAKGGKK